jgi:outer membrane protein assembly factor BamB
MHLTRLHRGITTSLIVLALSLPSLARAQTSGPVLVRSNTQEWSQWRGPSRDGVSRETGLLQSWPEDGPARDWSVNGIGRGYSSPIIADETIYITGDGETELTISALFLDGKPRWRVKNGAAWNKSYPGARSTCAYDQGKLYHMNAHGRLVCLDAKTGAEAWAVNVLQRFQGENILWGICESVVVHGDLVFATPAGKKGLVVALNKNTGETVWATPAIAGEKPSYASPILVVVGGRTLFVNNAANHAFAVDAKTGELCWKLPKLDPKNSVTTIPVLVGNELVMTNGSRGYGVAYGVRLDGSTAEKTWDKKLKIREGSMVCVDGTAYGASLYGDYRGWVALDAKTGEVEILSALDGGSLIYADGRFYCLTSKGTMTLQQRTAEGFKTVGNFQVADERDVWAHPVISGGKLYLRVHDTLFCYDIRS